MQYQAPYGPPPGSGYPGASYNQAPIQNATPGYPGAAAASAPPPPIWGPPSGSTSWNPRMGPPPPPPVTNGYPGVPGGNWVGDQAQGGAFYSAPMGQPREPALRVIWVIR